MTLTPATFAQVTFVPGTSPLASVYLLCAVFCPRSWVRVGVLFGIRLGLG